MFQNGIEERKVKLHSLKCLTFGTVYNRNSKYVLLVPVPPLPGSAGSRWPQVLNQNRF